MFADPQSITIDTVATSFPRIGGDATSSHYRSATGLVLYDGSGQVFDLTIGTTFTKQRARSVARLDMQGNVQNVLGDVGIHSLEGYSAYLVYDRPIAPIMCSTAADQVNFVSAFTTWATTSSNAAITKLVNGES